MARQVTQLTWVRSEDLAKHYCTKSRPSSWLLAPECGINSGRRHTNFMAPVNSYEPFSGGYAGGLCESYVGPSDADIMR